MNPLTLIKNFLTWFYRTENWLITSTVIATFLTLIAVVRFFIHEPYFWPMVMTIISWWSVSIVRKDAKRDRRIAEIFLSQVEEELEELSPDERRTLAAEIGQLLPEPVPVAEQPIVCPPHKWQDVNNGMRCARCGMFPLDRSP